MVTTTSKKTIPAEKQNACSHPRMTRFQCKNQTIPKRIVSDIAGESAHDSLVLPSDSVRLNADEFVFRLEISEEVKSSKYSL